jgi:putative transcriptional regulator
MDGLEMGARFRLDELLEAKGMSQNELSRLFGVSYPTISALVHNKTAGATLKTLDAISKVLKCEPGDLIKKSR